MPRSVTSYSSVAPPRYAERARPAISKRQRRWHAQYASLADTHVVQPQLETFQHLAAPKHRREATPSIKDAAVDDAAHVINLDHVRVSGTHATGRGRRSGLDGKHLDARRPEALILRLLFNIIRARLDVSAWIVDSMRARREGERRRAEDAPAVHARRRVINHAPRRVQDNIIHTARCRDRRPRRRHALSPTASKASSRSLGAALAYFASLQSRSAENAYTTPPSAK